MDIFAVFTMLGGLALFLFGMNIMGNALEKQAGDKLQSILSKLSDKRIKGFLLGLGITAIIQSSSATTVMVVGFVNSGLLQLSNAIGIIMGANVGTTVTAWILSLTGISSTNFFMQMLKPTSFSPVLAVVGILLFMAAKTEKKKNLGTIFLGFAILMTGMTTMTNAVEPLKDVPAFQNLFIMSQNPLFGLMIGAVITAIIQSSSASVGILQALTTTGAITFGNAIPIILGQNIGTTVTAIISGVGANKNARRTALVHLYFNIIGSTIFLVLFVILNKILQFEFISNSIGPAEIALVHTAFNIFASLILMPFANGLEKLAYLTIPEDETQEKTTLLDERLLLTPAIAVGYTKNITVEMAETARKAMFQAMSLIDKWNPKIAKEIKEEEEAADKYQDTIGTYLVKLTNCDMSIEDSHTVNIILHVINDMERIADYAVDMVFTLENVYNNKNVFSDFAKEELHILQSAVQDILNLTMDSFAENNYINAEKVEPINLVISGLIEEIKERHFARLQTGQCDIQSGLALADILHNLQRTAAHCSNIAAAIIEVEKNSMNCHNYVRALKNDESQSFRSYYQDYRDKHGLPPMEELV